MASNEEGTLLHVDPRKLFVALQIVKSKPPHLSIREYIASIRDSVKCAKDHEPRCSRLLSEASKQQSAEIAKLKVAATASAARIACLEQEIAELHRKLGFAAELGNGSKGKRRRSNRMLQELETFNESPPKRRKLGATARSTAQEAQAEELAIPFKSLSLPSAHANTFLRQFFILRSLMAREQCPAENLSCSLLSLIDQAMSIIKSSRISLLSLTNRPIELQRSSPLRVNEHQVPNTEKTGISELSELSMVSSSVHTLLDGLSHLDSGRSGPIICAFLKMFRDCLSYIIESVPRQTSGDDAASRLNQSKSQARPRLQAPSQYEMEEDKVDLLGRFLVFFLSSLDFTKPLHQNILDGCMYFLLSVAAKYLKAFVFEEHVDHRGRPQYHQTTTRSVDPKEQSCSSLTASAAANLIWILERAMVLNGESTTMLRQSTSAALPVDQEDPAKRITRLPDVARVRIQSTLLQPLFKDQHVKFADCFKEPDLSHLMIDNPPPSVFPGDVCNWFKQEIWRIVGWETIREKIE